MGPQGAGIHTYSGTKKIEHDGDVVVSDAHVIAGSIIMVSYVQDNHDWTSEPLSILSQGIGSFEVSGEKNKWFSYVILNPD
jgi:hypothetical protein